MVRTKVRFVDRQRLPKNVLGFGKLAAAFKPDSTSRQIRRFGHEVLRRSRRRHLHQKQQP
jgi:hypothetical protein